MFFLAADMRVGQTAAKSALLDLSNGNDYSLIQLRSCASIASAYAPSFQEESAVNDQPAKGRNNRSLLILSLGGLLALIGLILALGGTWLAILGGSLYYLLAGKPYGRTRFRPEVRRTR